MPDLEDLVSKIPIGQIADRLGVPPAIANGLVRTALPALVGGMQANAQDPAGEASLAGALGQHAGGPVGQVDEADGQKIVGHLFGDNEGAVVSRLGEMSNTAGGDGLMAKLLPMLAPMVMSWVASDLLGGSGGGSGDGGDNPLGDLLGGVAGGGGLGGALGGLGDLAKGAVAEDGADLAGALGLSEADTGGGLSGILGGLLQNELHGEGGVDELLGGLLGGGTK